MNTVLIVDDDPSIRLLLARVLQRVGYEVREASHGAQALELVATHEPQLVILDLTMPGLSGIEVCRALKENPFTSHIPILMLTAQSGVDYKVQGFDAGADDYLDKPFDPRELIARVGALLRLVQREADRNPSSGLPGGRSLARELERCARAGKPFAVCYFDIDRFKPFADAWGFVIADEVITRTGEALRSAARAFGSFVGHIGGDDFIGVIGREHADAFAREVRRRFDGVISDILCEAPMGAAAIERGSFVGLDRQGVEADIPLSRLSAVVVEVEPERWISPAHLGAHAAALKRQVKASGAGVLAGALE